MDIDHECMDLSAVSYKHKVNICSKVWCDTLQKHSYLGNQCELSFLKDGIKFKFEGDHGSAELNLSHNTEEKSDGIDNLCNSVTTMQVEDRPLGSFSMRYLNACSKINKLSNRIIVEYSHDLPLCLTTRYLEKSFIRCFLAPMGE